MKLIYRHIFTIGTVGLAIYFSSCNSNDNEFSKEEYRTDTEENSAKLTNLGDLENLSSNIHSQSTADPLWDKHIFGNDVISDAVNKHARAWSDYIYFTESHPKLKSLFDEDKSLESGNPRKREIRAEIKKIGESISEIMAERRKVDLAQINLIETKAAEWNKVEGGKKYADQYLELAKQARKLLKK